MIVVSSAIVVWSLVPAAHIISIIVAFAALIAWNIMVSLE